jgi:hypothetical protein
MGVGTTIEGGGVHLLAIFVSALQKSDAIE